MTCRSILAFALVLVATGCRSDAPVAPTEVQPDSVNPGHGRSVPPGLFTVSGLVFEAESGGMRPLPGVEIWVAVETSPGPGIFSYYQHGKVSSDAHGRYQITALPAGLAWISGGSSPAARGGDPDGYLQPCAAAVRVDSDTTFDLELVSRRNTLPQHARRPLTLAGTVFELTPNGRLAVAGARVFVEKDLDFVATGAVSDALGRYELCGLPADTWQVFAVKDGYRMWVGGSSWVSSNRTLDIELRRDE